MSTERARKILDRQSEMESRRSRHNSVWQEVADYTDSDSPDFFRLSGLADRSSQVERAERRMRRVYDVTAMTGRDRLCAGLESLITPQSEKWHGISTAAFDDEETEEEREWGEGVRDFLFDGVRYQAAANFVPAIQAVYHNVTTFGPAYLYAEDFPGGLIRYASIPTAEGYIIRDRWGMPQYFHRKYQRTAFQVAQIVGFDKLSPKLKELANDPIKRFEKITLVQAIEPREDNERRTLRIQGQTVYVDYPWASYHVVEQDEAVAMERGFRTFPVACFSWGRQEGDDYGTSPCIKALVTIMTGNEVSRTTMEMIQQSAAPPLAVAAALDYVPDTSPGAHNRGAIDKNGRSLIQPLVTGINPAYAAEYGRTQTEILKDQLYINLFQSLAQNPDETATAALIRNEEKGQLLGPAGSVIQGGLSQLFDREMSILEDKGLYDEGSRFVPPESLAGKAIRVAFTSPLDFLRRAAEVRETVQGVETISGLAQATGDPSYMDNIDPDGVVAVIRSGSRMPQRALRRKEDIAAIRERRSQEAQQQKGIAALSQIAATAADAVPAAVQANEAGLALPGVQP